MTTLTAPPTPPSTASPASFDTNADAFLGWFPTAWAELQILSDAIDAAVVSLTAYEAVSTAFSTSSTSNTIASSGDKTFTVSSGKGFLPGNYVRIARTSAPYTTWMSGFVKTYSSTTLVVTVDYSVGSGTYTDWTISPASINGLPAATAANVWLGSSSALSITPATFAGVTAFVSLTDAATIATDASTGINFKVTLGGNRTMGAPTNLIDGRSYAWAINTGAGSFTLAWNAIFDWGDAGAPTITTTASKVDFAYGQYSSTTGKIHMTFRRSA